jgi:phospholipase/carboxylesterase
LRALALCCVLCACRAEPPVPESTSRGNVTHGSTVAMNKPFHTRLRTHAVAPERSGAPVVVVLHGFGAPGDDLLPVAEWLAARTPFRYVVAEALHALPQGGRAWWNIDFAAREAQLRRGEGLDLRSERPPGIDDARAAVSTLLEDVQAQLGAGPDQLALVGFSQGAMLSMETALHLPSGPRCLGMLSGTFLSEATWAPRFPAHAQLPVYMSHGRADGVLPFQRSSELRDALTAQGWSVEFVPFAGGHEIPMPVLAGLATFLTRCFAAP